MGTRCQICGMVLSDEPGSLGDHLVEMQDAPAPSDHESDEFAEAIRAHEAIATKRESAEIKRDMVRRRGL